MEPPHTDSNSQLLVQVELAVSLVELAKTSVDREEVRRLRECAQATYAQAIALLPAGIRTMSHKEEAALWDRLALVRRWLESTAALFRT